MPDLDLAGLRAHLAGARVAVIVAERDARAGTVRAYALDVDQSITADFRDRAAESLLEYENKLVDVPFAENTILSDHEYAVADRTLLDERLLSELIRAAGVGPQRDHPPHPDQLRLYAIVAANDDHEALFIRQQNPVKHLRRDQITLNLLGSRLTRADTTFVYDANFDVVVFDQVAWIRRQGALETLFMDETLREADTQRSLTAMAPFIREVDHANLVAAAETDSMYAAKLRRCLRAGVFDGVDMAAIEQTIDDFGLELRVVAGRLVFPRTRPARWELIYTLEDAFVQGRATGRRYRANSKRRWDRRSVTEVVVVGGRVGELRGRGPWSPRAAGDVLADLASGRQVEYIARLDDGPALIEVHSGASRPELWVSGDTAVTNRLLELRLPEA